MDGPIDEGTGAKSNLRPESGVLYRAAAYGASGAPVDFRGPGELVIFGLDPRCDFVFPSSKENEDISRVMGVIYMGKRYPVVLDCSKNGLYVEKLSRALRDQPSFLRDMNIIRKMFNAGIIGTNMRPQLTELLFGNPKIAGAFDWEYRRPENDPISFIKDDNGKDKKFPRQTIAMYDLESEFYKAGKGLVQIVLSTPNNPRRKIEIARLEH